MRLTASQYERADAGSATGGSTRRGAEYEAPNENRLPKEMEYYQGEDRSYTDWRSIDSDGVTVGCSCRLP